MTKITENEIELFAIELLEKQGSEYIYFSDIASYSKVPRRNTLLSKYISREVQID